MEIDQDDQCGLGELTEQNFPVIFFETVFSVPKCYNIFI